MPPRTEFCPLEVQLLTALCRDIVDSEHCSGDVNKMLLGSFVEEYDLFDDDEPAPMFSIAELDAGPLTESPSQQPIGYFPTSSNAETGLFEMPTRRSMGPQVQRNMSTARLQREPSTRSSTGVQREPSTRSSRHSYQIR